MTDQRDPVAPTDDHQQTEKRILDAARTVFTRRGTAGARMQEIAAMAGVNQALLHYYFRSKERLAAAVFREAASRMVPATVRLIRSNSTLEEKLERFVHLYIDTVSEHPYLPGYVLAELHTHPDRLTALKEISRELRNHEGTNLLEQVSSDIEQAVREGRIRRISPIQLLANVGALCVFPFAARPLFSAALGMDDDSFREFLRERRAELPQFILGALRP